MANRFAIANGNFNATSTWSDTAGGVGGFSVPVAGDNAYANSKTVTITADATCDKISTEAENGATGSGGFVLNGGVTLTANVKAGGGAYCLTCSPTSPAVSYIIGDIYGSTTVTSSNGATLGGTGTIYVTGNITAGSFSGSKGIDFSGAALNITGNLIGAAGGSTTSTALSVSGAGSINVIGSINGASFGVGNYIAVLFAGSGVMTVTGNCTGGSGLAHTAISNSSIGTLNIIGTVTGGTGAGAWGVRNVSTGTVNITGSAVGGTNGGGANNESTGIIRCTRAKGNAYGVGSVGISAGIVGLNSAAQASLSYVEEIEYGDLGQSPVAGPIILTDKTSNVALFYRPSGLSKKTLIDAASISGALPAASDVRLNVVYNLGNTIGSCAVPSANSVAWGVPVDNTSGVAVLTQSGIWGASMLIATGVTGSIGNRLGNCATVATVGAQLSAALTH